MLELKNMNMRSNARIDELYIAAHCLSLLYTFFRRLYYNFDDYMQLQMSIQHFPGKGRALCAFDQI